MTNLLTGGQQILQREVGFFWLSLDTWTHEGSHFGTGRQVKQALQSTQGYVELTQHEPREKGKWQFHQKKIICQPLDYWSGSTETHNM